ncbi:hypothetical protein FHG87_023345 [Trinorchestia longiramus]|nr:hypothetical protein FHG87_023345 [Trinorchestia longiramus]
MEPDGLREATQVAISNANYIAKMLENHYKVTGEGSNRQTERIHRQRDATPATEVGSQCRLTFKLPVISAFDLSALVASPKGTSEAAETMELENGLYAAN